MVWIPPIAEARAAGEELTAESVRRIRSRMQREVRRSLGVPRPVRPSCDDAGRAYFPPESVTRRVHADLPAMLVGGLGALLFQMLHPLAMAGVAEFSNYREDPLGRLQRTAAFLSTTTFGSTDEAETAIEKVRRVHRAVTGVAGDGRRYQADDPALVSWVHAAELRCFLGANRLYGPRRLTCDDEDRYVGEMSRVAEALGAVEVPVSVAELDAYLRAVRPELRLTTEAKEARNFVLRGVGRWPHEVTAYGLLVAAAAGVLPPWARRQLHLPYLPIGDRLAVRPTVRTLAAALRWVTVPTAPSGPKATAPSGPKPTA